MRGLNMINIILMPAYGDEITAGHIGTVADVIAGHVPEELAKRKFSAVDYKYGFELASPEGMSSLGEAVLVNNFCYSTSTDQLSTNYLKTISAQSFATSGIFLIPNDAKPTYLIKQTFESSCLLNDVYDALFAKIKQPFAFAAIIEFETLHGTFVAKAPIHDENIFEHKASYYPFAPQILVDVPAFLVGVVANYGDSRLASLLKKLEVVLYRNPFDKEHSNAAHAHGITLKQHVIRSDAIMPEIVDKTLHILADQSRIKSLHGEIFTIGDLKDFYNK